jgi:soluble lytic murein transglycosylase
MHAFRCPNRATRAILMAIALGILSAPAAAGTAGTPKPKPDGETAEHRLVTAAEFENWAAVRRHRTAVRDPLLAKYGIWLGFQHDETGYTFDDIATFLDANPTWPRRAELQRRAESSIDGGISRDALIDWFSRNPPTTGEGAHAHLSALKARGHDQLIATLVPRYWVELGFDRPGERNFLKAWGSHLSQADHQARLDNLIWNQHHGSARRMLTRVGSDQSALGFARISLQRRSPGVDGAIARVPEHLRDAPELWYERLRWRRRKGLDSDARGVLYDLAGIRPQPERWALEGRILARRALGEGHYSEAVRLVSGHGLSDGAEFAESEFLAGWIRLSFLQEPNAAEAHFGNLYNGVRYPISRARAAYWSGRTAQARGNAELAREWWERAAAHPATFYGQQALAALGKPVARFDFTAPRDPAVRAAFVESELVRLVHRLHALGADDGLRTFLLHLAGLADSVEERLLVAQLAQESGRPREAIRAVKRANQIDNVIGIAGYPTRTLPQLPQAENLEAALVLSVIRQESAFDPGAISGANARGMMQLIPATAERVAQSLELPYSKRKLLYDPDYNIRLGSTYLAQMLERFDGSVPLALAAYNAGPHRVVRWVREYGDPRSGQIDMLDWIETIPFTETRNYVQRVLENVPVYRYLLSETQLAEHRPTPLRQDITRP